MAKQFLQLLLRQMMLMKELVHDLVQEPGLLAGGGPYALGIKHHHDGERAPDSGERRTSRLGERWLVHVEADIDLFSLGGLQSTGLRVEGYVDFDDFESTRP